MPQDYTVGRHTTRRRKQHECTVSVSVKPRVYERLVRMQQALQREIGPDQTVTLSGIIRRLIYQHPAIRPIVKRHYTLPPDTGDDLVT
jgi:hypothetical protein